jgi:hypothetical protein
MDEGFAAKFIRSGRTSTPALRAAIRIRLTRLRSGGLRAEFHNWRAVRSGQTYHGRRAATIENDRVRLTVLHEGGHIAEVLDKETGVNPLWTPPWPSIEPSTFDARAHGAAYGGGVDAKLLAGIMGHNLCLDIFGGPSPDEAADGLTPHGEASVAPYDISERANGLAMTADLPIAQIRLAREIDLRERSVEVRERIESLCGFDRPIGWTQHVTLGPPFLEKGTTIFRASAARSKTFESAFGADDYLQPSAVFDWPNAPRRDGTTADLRLLTSERRSSAYTAHAMSREAKTAFFVAFSRRARLAFGYVWRTRDFPWLGIWEENHSRLDPPWNGRTLARGMEFGVSPFPETRRAMVDRGSLFDVPTFRWLPARASLEASYRIVLQRAETIPESYA